MWMELNIEPAITHYEFERSGHFVNCAKKSDLDVLLHK